MQVSFFDFALLIETPAIRADLAFFRQIGFLKDPAEPEGMTALSDRSLRILLRHSTRARTSLILYCTHIDGVEAAHRRFRHGLHYVAQDRPVLNARTFLDDPEGVRTFLVEQLRHEHPVSGQAPGLVCGTFSNLRLVTRHAEATRAHYGTLGFRERSYRQQHAKLCRCLNTDLLMLCICAAVPETTVSAGRLAITYVDESVTTIIDRLQGLGVSVSTDALSGAAKLRSPGGQVILLGN
ncbi:hypothetical protein [Roseibium sp.]|uniref:hypothetical protein n=2 Tax=Roseibium sp. TaxID=1936156 RepID=UPI0032658AB1